MRSKLHLTDTFAFAPRINYLKRNRFGTVEGTIATLILVAITLYFFIYFMTPIWTRSEPYIVYSKKAHPSGPLTEIKTNNFNLGIALTNRLMMNRQIPIDPSVLQISFLEISLTTIRDSEGNPIMGSSVKQLISGPCEKVDLPPGTETLDSVKNTQLNYILCLKKNQTFKLLGSFADPVYSFIKVTARLCKNDSISNALGIVCKPLEYITAQAQQLSLTLIVLNPGLDLLDFNNPIKAYGFRKIFMLDPSITKNLEINMKRNSLVTDDNLLFKENSKTFEYIDFSSSNSDYNIGEGRDGVLIDILVQMDNVEDIYIRSYDKIPDVLALVGGLFKLLVSFVALFIFPLSELLFKMDLLNVVGDLQTSGGILVNSGKGSRIKKVLSNEFFSAVGVEKFFFN